MTRRLALVAIVGLVSACASDPPSTSESASETTTSDCEPAVDRVDVPYVENGHPLQRFDLYLPDGEGCAPVPLVVWVHGGGWRIGDKRNSMEAKVRLWNGAGWAVASVNYRLSDPTVPESHRVMAPSHNEDVAAAIGWMVDHAQETGVDPTHIALLGHSAGAGIVASLAADPTYLAVVGMAPAHLSCVVPLDTEAFSIESAAASGGALGEIYASAFGTDPERWDELSPITHVGEADLPDLLLVTRGTAVRRQLVATFAAAATEAGGDVTIVDLPSFSHEDVNKEIGSPDDTELTPPLQEFLTACLTV